MKTERRDSKRLAEVALSPASYTENINLQSGKKSNAAKRPRSVIENPNENDEFEMTPEYDVIRQKNIETRERLFTELNIGQTLTELKQSTPSSKNVKPSNRGLAAVKRSSLPNPLPERKSLRLQKIDAESGLQLPDKEPTLYSIRSVEDRPRPPLEDLFIKDVAEWRESEDLDEIVHEKTDYLKKLTASQSYDAKTKSSFDGDIPKTIKNLKISPERVSKVTPSRIFSMAVHPMTSSLLVAAGDKWGAIGLWNVNDTTSEKHGVEVFYPHSRPINCLSFNPFDSTKLVSTSYDGSVRSFDLEDQVFNLVYAAEDDEADHDYTGSHCNVDANTYLVSLGRTGIVGLVDTRVSNRTRVRDFQVYNRVAARMATLHPVQKHLFLAPNSKAECNIFDMRAKTKTMTPVISLKGHTKSLSSAMFSSVTGDSVVTVCWDHKLRIYDIRNGTGDITPKKQISHNNNTGKWLTTFKAEFHPRRDDLFFVGSMSYPRQMDAFTVSGDHYPLRGEDLTSICSIVKAHPTLDVVVGGNSSGRVFAFM